jgi:hypothetical protein
VYTGASTVKTYTVEYVLKTAVHRGIYGKTYTVEYVLKTAVHRGIYGKTYTVEYVKKDNLWCIHTVKHIQ